MTVLLILIYLAFCFLVAFSAKHVAIGFWGVLVMSIFLTPLLTAILVVILRPKPKKMTKEDWEDLEEEY